VSDRLALANAIEDAGIERGGWADRQGRWVAQAEARYRPGAPPVRRSTNYG
jgi:hypothetical protein